MLFEVHDGHGRVLCEAEDIPGALLGARTIVGEESSHLGSSRLVRADLIVTCDGVYHAAATGAARCGHLQIRQNHCNI